MYFHIVHSRGRGGLHDEQTVVNVTGKAQTKFADAERAAALEPVAPFETRLAELEGLVHHMTTLVSDDSDTSLSGPAAPQRSE